jgi:DNA segregation ATPase FtsK/SpoIIIE, S-DNA-T family
VRTTDLAEVQLALLAADPAGPAQIAALTAIGEAAHGRAVGRGPQPLRVEPLPASVQLAELLAAQGAPGTGSVVLGAGGDTAGPIGLALADSSAIVAGPPRSGRSTALCTLADDLARQGQRIVALAPVGTPLSRQPAQDRAVTVFGGDDAPALAACLTSQSECVVLVDDAELVAGTESEEVLLRWFKRRPRGSALVVASTLGDMASSFRGLSVVARRSGQGLLLNPSSPADGDLFGVRLPSVSNAIRRPGRGFLVQAGQVIPIQVARSS